ncbi:sulfite exporter TauE/SafE family protein [uncultured Vibrio sp.]|uniref:sulfite exporter TauE/SafE family protein n=1 Tax=uncultured Vibrio sp. TaxID=114054 RepID=UPI0025FB7A1B|nr:sulfite exporter TauE/SafE family protein [uncultured Vibrio sp.]
MAVEWTLLFFAGVFGGILNTVAGGGSFITFPALLAFGVPPIAANATNTFAVSAGYISGAYGFRGVLKNDKQLIKVMALSSIGGIVGAFLLLSIPDSTFLVSIPWLLLFATLLFIFGKQIQAFFASALPDSKGSANIAKLVLPALLLFVSAYGGFFNAGLGVVALSYLVLAGYSNIHQMNGLKLVISTCVSLSAIVVFVAEGMIDWSRGGVVLTGTLVGGYVAARVSQGIAPHYIRYFVSASSALITIYFFIRTYG